MAFASRGGGGGEEEVEPVSINLKDYMGRPRKF